MQAEVLEGRNLVLCPSSSQLPLIDPLDGDQYNSSAPNEEFPRQNGHPEKVKIFLVNLHTQFMLQPQIHASNAIKVLTAISHLEGSTQVWATSILEDYCDKLIENYTVFIQELQAQFGDSVSN